MSQSKNVKYEVYLILLPEPNDEVRDKVVDIWPDHYSVSDTMILVMHAPEGNIGWAHEVYNRLAAHFDGQVRSVVIEVRDNFGFYNQTLWTWLEKVGR